MSESSARDIEKHPHNHQALEYSNGGETQRPRRRRMANPAPIGLFAFAATTFLLSLFNLHTRGVQTPNVIIGMAVFAGGLVQLLAGMWEVPNGNTFGAVGKKRFCIDSKYEPTDMMGFLAFSAYGAFWMSYATIFIPGSGVIDSFGGDMEQFSQAIGLYLITWFLITVLFIPPVVKRNIALTILLSVLALALLMLSIGAWNGKESVNKAGGVFGVITGLIAFYIGVAMMLLEERTAIVRLPLGVLSED
ncbi:hypothetical protein NP233_g4260 [Leucocoprinus birnbaumii]|uniref:Uncharacterized protein n=1 Tax=Leucocoprinus birnbaumii TaxID=56174 RepID=A0AAD5YVN9_9AGAR|nr:hypothetical protein NP233_g4260 [Leucocoprinus birnbaumii]